MLRAIVLLVQIMLVGAIFAPSTLAVSTAEETPRGCGPQKFEGELPMPPDGAVVNMQTYTLTANCEVIASEVVTVPVTALNLEPSSPARSFSSIGASSSTMSGSDSGCCWEGYMVQRSWDCCGIKMNEYWTELDFSSSNGVIDSWWARDGGAWHTEHTCGGNGGWWPNTSDHYLYASYGGVGYDSVTVAGRQGYDYSGFFDGCTGPGNYYNAYQHGISGVASGTWYCSYSHYWKASAAGWSLQAWCGTGDYWG